MLIACEWREDAMDTGLLIARLVFGLLMAVHGSQKLFGWFGGPGMSGTAAFLEGLGFRPGRFFAVANALAECVGGILLALGLFEPVAAAAIVRHDRRYRDRAPGERAAGAQRRRTPAPLPDGSTIAGAHRARRVLDRRGARTEPVVDAADNGIVLAAGVVGGFAHLGLRPPSPTVAHT
jgi:hypothetical protein